jgi:hypothetical protein
MENQHYNENNHFENLPRHSASVHLRNIEGKEYFKSPW